MDAPTSASSQQSSAPRSSRGAFRSDHEAQIANCEVTEVGCNGFEVEADIAAGDSGAALITAEGVAGIVFARSSRTEGRAWATSIGEARPLLDADTGAPVDVGNCLE